MSRSTSHEAETLTDDELRELLAYPQDLDRPLLRANFIASIDGAVTLDGAGRKLGTPTDRRVFTRLREVADVILVGATTAKAKPYTDIQLSAEAKAWRSSRGLSPEVQVAVVSSRGVISQQLLDNPTPPIVFVSASADESTRLELEASGAIVRKMPPGQIGSAAVRNGLSELGLNRVLVEGGPTFFSQLVADNEIDELCLTTSPMMVAGPARRVATAADHVEIHMQRKTVLLGADGTVIVRWVRR
ncbi:deaminase [Mycobacterium sp. ACS1612]|nr:deaminase [Mycobacterium sp. ACS1612]